MILYKSWRPKGLFQVEIIINVLVSSFWFIWMPTVGTTRNLAKKWRKRKRIWEKTIFIFFLKYFLGKKSNIFCQRKYFFWKKLFSIFPLFSIFFLRGFTWLHFLRFCVDTIMYLLLILMKMNYIKSCFSYFFVNVSMAVLFYFFVKHFRCWSHSIRRKNSWNHHQTPSSLMSMIKCQRTWRNKWRRWSNKSSSTQSIILLKRFQKWKINS